MGGASERLKNQGLNQVLLQCEGRMRPLHSHKKMSLFTKNTVF